MTTSQWRDVPVFQIGNLQDISAWQTDPRTSLIDRHKVGLVMVPPMGLDKFLSPDHHADDDVRFIHGAKGSGKTSLLLAKRVQLDQAVAARQLLCVPAGFPYVFFPFMDGTQITFGSWESLAFAHPDAWKYAWLVLLGAYILNAVERDRPAGTRLTSENLVNFLTAAKGVERARLDERDWVTHFKHLIENTRNPCETFKRVYEAEVLPHLQGTIRDFGKQILIFVDGIDETFVGPNGSPLLKLVKNNQLEKLLRRNGGAVPDAIDDPNDLARQVWVNAQISLLSVAADLALQTEGVVRLIGSMRTEAYLEASRKGPQSIAQRANYVRAIEYTGDHLEAIMRANIRASMRLSPLDKPAKEDEIGRFFGSAAFRVSKLGVDEPIFQYLCRHTFGEPRELMLLGARIGAMSPASRSSSGLEKIVSKTTNEIFTDYFRFMDEDWDTRYEEIVFARIEKNILTYKDAEAIAADVQKASNISHPLCYLYQRGLIGTVADSLQTFQRIAGAVAPSRRTLPRSNVFLMHPVLDSSIARAREGAARDSYRIVPGMPVGNGLPWKPGMREKRIRLQVDGKIVRLHIDRTSLSSSTEGMSMERRPYPGFHTLADLPTAVFVTCLQEMENLQSDHVSIDLVIQCVEQLIRDGIVPRIQRRGGERVSTADYLKETLYATERQPPIFETVKARLQEYNLTCGLSRSLKHGTLTIRGIGWEEIEVVI